jgi:hypothetical protein
VSEASDLNNCYTILDLSSQKEAKKNSNVTKDSGVDICSSIGISIGDAGCCLSSIKLITRLLAKMFNEVKANAHHLAILLPLYK